MDNHVFPKASATGLSRCWLWRWDVSVVYAKDQSRVQSVFDRFHRFIYQQAFDRKYGFDFAHSNIELEAIPFDVKFDVILFTEILERLNFIPLYTLRKLHRALNERGVLLLSTPDASTWGRLDYYSHWTDMPEPNFTKEIGDAHVYQYHHQEVNVLLDKAGFEIEKLDYSGIEKFKHFNIVCRKKVIA